MPINKYIKIIILILVSNTSIVFSEVSESNISGEISLLDLIIQGGWAMYPLGLFSVATLYFIIRNAILLKEKSMLRFDLKEQIEQKMKQQDLDGVRLICSENSGLIMSVLDVGIERIGESEYNSLEQIQEGIEEAGNEQMVIYMKPINYLSIIGGTAPMLGLLGTVSGMIKAFSIISQGGMGDPGKLAGSIGEALITTATGLVIAIPAMIAYFIFKNNFIKTMSSMSRLVSHYINIYRVSIRNNKG